MNSDISTEFFCPTCQEVRTCKVKRVSDVLTDYAMPLWDGDLGSYVECDHCGDAFHPAVLKQRGMDPDKAHAAFRTLMIGVMVSMMDADGKADQRELDTIRRVYEGLAGGPVPPAVLQQGIELARVAGAEGALKLAEKFRPTLNQLSRELVFRAALWVSATDQRFGQEEMDFLESVGEALGLDQEHIQAIFKSAREEGLELGGLA